MGLLTKIAAAFRPAPPPAPVGRNDTCWCGSGKKYKRCHLDADRIKAQAQNRSCTSS